jgi:hypothetical protein
MSDPRKIVAARIEPAVRFGDMAVVYIQTHGNEGEEEKLFSYFEDEISFRGTELVDLTVDQAYELRHKKDVAYLQS